MKTPNKCENLPKAMLAAVLFSLMLFFGVSMKAQSLPVSIIRNAPCNGSCMGAAVAVPTDLVVPYTYAWSNGANHVLEEPDTEFHLCPGFYTVTVTDGNNTVVQDSFTVLANGPIFTTDSQAICAGNSYLGYSATGIYVDTFTAVEGCDSINTLYLFVDSVIVTSLSETICYGSSYTGDTTSGTYVDTFTASGGCDSIQILTLTVIQPQIDINETGNGCLGSTSLTVNGIPAASVINWQLNGNTFETGTIGLASGTTVAGGNGAGSASNQLNNCFGVFVDSMGNVYASDYNNGRVQKWAPGASYGVTVAGGNGQGSAANQLYWPSGIYVDKSGNIYIADRNNERIQEWKVGDSTGITVAGGNGNGGAANQFSNPLDVYLDSSGNIYVADQYNARVQMWAPGATSGTTVMSGFEPTGVFVDKKGNLYATDQFDQEIDEMPAGTANVIVAVSAGQGSGANDLNFPVGVWVDSSGNIYIGDQQNNRVQKWAPGASSGITVAGGNGQGSAANQFSGPAEICLDAYGNIYIADMANDRVQEWAPSGDSTYTPTAAGGYSATIVTPQGCAVNTDVITVRACSDTIVWPGDANNDGIANYLDILTLGLAYLDTGSVRPDRSNQWIGQPCPPWAMNIPSEGNADHADCNGDGIVNANDTVPILLNYAMTHSKFEQADSTPGAALIYFGSISDTLGTGKQITVSIDLGTETNMAENVLGIGFTINYDGLLVDDSTAAFYPINSWLGTPDSDLIYIQKSTGQGSLDVGMTRIDHNNRSGYGPIGELTFVTIDNLSGKTAIAPQTLHLDISGVQMIMNDGTRLPVDMEPHQVVIGQGYEGITTPNGQPFMLVIYPNPTTGMVNYMTSGMTARGEYTIDDITGRTLFTGEIAPGNGTATGQLDMSSFAKGVYFFRMHSADGNVVRKIVLQ